MCARGNNADTAIGGSCLTCDNIVAVGHSVAAVVADITIVAASSVITDAGSRYSGHDTSSACFLTEVPSEAWVTLAGEGQDSIQVSGLIG